MPTQNFFFSQNIDEEESVNSTKLQIFPSQKTIERRRRTIYFTKHDDEFLISA